MPTIQFVGRIFPDKGRITFSSVAFNSYNKSLDLHLSLTPKFDGNRVTVVCEISRPFDPKSHFLALYIQVHDLVRSILDLITFSNGISLGLSFEKIIHDDGTDGDILFHDDSVAQYASSVSSPEGLGSALAVAIENPEIQLALRDLAESLAHLYAAPINCARAVEAIRNQFVPEGGKREDGWPPMREALNLTEAFLKKITDVSRNPRHGRDRRIMGDPIRMVGYGAWKVMNRYLEYKKRGDQRLTDPDFPLLD